MPTELCCRGGLSLYRLPMATRSPTRLHVPFSDLWSMRIDHPYSLLVRANRHAWSCGQCPLSDDGSVLAPDDLARQADHVDDYIQRILGKVELPRGNVGKLVLYHAAPEPAGVETVLSRFRVAQPDTILFPVGVPFFY